MRSLHSRQMVPIMVTSVIIISLPYIWRIYRRAKHPPKTGLLVLYPSPDPEETYHDGAKVSDEAFDIVAVHGLGADPLYTWAAKTVVPHHDPGPNRLLQILNPRRTRYVRWLQDFLPVRFPTARIMVFSHNAEWLINAPIKTAEDSARNLLIELSKKRTERNKSHPILFLAHSFGGIVVKDAFTMAKEDETYKDIYEATRGIIFLGTPHQGSDLSLYGRLLSTVAMPLLGSNTMLLRSLRYHDMHLRQKTKNFLQQSSNSDVHICCFFETLPTCFYGCSVGLVVDQTSATLHGYGEVPSNKNHSQLNKFTDADDETYQTICSEIEKARRNPSYLSHITQTLLLEKLQRDCAPEASFNSRLGNGKRFCIPSTRKELLQRIATWSTTSNRSHIFWLHGMAGTGKSTIARTFAKHCADRNRLGASFFFSRGEDDLTSCKKFFITLAVQLAHNAAKQANLASLKQYICEAIDCNPGIAGEPLSDQWTTLIIEPLKRFRQHSLVRTPLVIVIDALDECEKDKDTKFILRFLEQAKDIGASQLQFLVTSRPVSPIRSGSGAFGGMTRDLYEDCPFTEVDRYPERDISIFFDFKLDSMKRSKEKKEGFILPQNWPGRERKFKLIKRADGLFIWAATACRFMRGHPGPYLDECLSSLAQEPNDPKSVSSSGVYEDQGSPTFHLDQLYTEVLSSSLRKIKSMMEHDLRKSVASIVVLADPLSVVALASLLGLPVVKLSAVLQPLFAVLDIPQLQESPIRLLHPSFRDFLLDARRCHDRRFWVDRREANSYLAECCIGLMMNHLKRDICDRGMPGPLVSEVHHQQFPRELQYACRFWVQHLEWSTILLVDDGLVHGFLRRHLLHWLEFLSVIGKTSEGVLALIRLNSMIKDKACPHLRALVYDAKRFALYNRTVIEEAPLQLYNSALVFAPETSLIRQTFSAQIPRWIGQLPTVPKKWSNLQQTLVGHKDYVRGVAFSPDGKLVASNSSDNTMKLWDAATGALQQTLDANSGFFTSVAFSPNSKLVASNTCYEAVNIWDATTGTLQKTLEGHSHSVTSLAFSPNGKWIASGSCDHTVKLWDVATGDVHLTLKGHTVSVNSVAFSPDGKRLASGGGSQNTDPAVILWDVYTGIQTHLLMGHRWAVRSIAFSPGGLQLASASEDGAIMLWDALSGAQLQTLTGHNDEVTAVAFSPKGSFLASASHDNTIRLWDTVTGALQQVIKGHTSWVCAVTFSPDGQQLASGSDDTTVGLWDIGSISADPAPEDHCDSIRSVAFSLDGQLLASASDDGTVRLWETKSGTLQRTHCVRNIWQVYFSPNETHLAAQSEFVEIRIWDIASGALEHTFSASCSSAPAPLMFSSEGRYLRLMSGDGCFQIWNTENGSLVQTLKGDFISSFSAAFTFSLDGQQIATSDQRDDHSVQLFDAESRTLLRSLHGQPSFARALAFSRDGKLLASASKSQVCIWDTNTGDLKKSLEVHAGIEELSYSNDSLRLITDRGSISLKALSINPADWAPYSLNGGESWVMWNGHPVLWIPPEYRNGSQRVRGHDVAIGCVSGRVVLIGFRAGVSPI